MSANGGGTDWTAEKIARLTAEWSAGTPCAVIGEHMGISKNAVVGKAHRLNLPPRPSPIIRDGVARPAQPRRVAAGVATLPPLDTQGVLHNPPPAPMKLNRLCCWPLGEPGKPSFHFCDAPCSGTYCATHAKIAFVKRHDEHDRESRR